MALTQNFYNFIKKSITFSSMFSTSVGSSNYIWASSSDNDLNFVDIDGTDSKSSGYGYFSTIFREASALAAPYNYTTNTYFPSNSIALVHHCSNQKRMWEDSTELPFLFKVGSSNTDVSPDDYNCKNVLDASCVTLSRIVSNDSESFDIKYILNVINNTDEKITIREIACFKPIMFSANSNYTAYSTTRYYCIDRTVLENPVEIDANVSKTVEYKFHLNN